MKKRNKKGKKAHSIDRVSEKKSFSKENLKNSKNLLLKLLKNCQKLLKKKPKQGTIIIGRDWFYYCNVMQ